MEPVQTEPKSSTMDEAIDKAFETVEGAATPGDAQPEAVAQAQPDQTGEGVTATLKTDSTPKAEDFKGVDGGFATHPAWIEREQKLKDAQRRIQELENRAKSVDERLGDPKLSKKEKDLLSIIAEKKGLDLETIDKGQLAYIKDLVDLAETVADLKAEEKLNKRLGPVEQVMRQTQAREQATKQIESAKEFATKYGLDWAKDIQPALNKTLDELDQSDPDCKNPFNLNDWIKDHALQIISERSRLQGRQDERDKVKSGLKPLTPGATGPTKSTQNRVPSFRSDPDGFNAAFDKAYDEILGS